ncbi:MAG: MFS transporter [Pseudomonadota bacterium]
MKAFSLRLSVFYAAYFAVVGVYLPFFPVWLSVRELTPVQIAIVLAAPQVMRVLFTPLMAIYAGRLGGLKTGIATFAVIGAVPIALLPVFDSYWPILIIVAVSALFWNPVLPLAEALAIAGVKRGSSSYGRMRLWGSWSFIAITLATGLIVDRLGDAKTIWLIVIAYAVAAMSALALREPDTETPVDSGRSLSVRQASRLFRFWPLMAALVAAASIQASHAVIYAFGTIHWASQGIDFRFTGALWSIGVIAEIVLFAFSAAAARAFGGFGLIAIAGAAGILRWFFMSFDPPLEALFLLQILHGLTFGATHLGSVEVIAKTVPENLVATAQALSFTIGGLAMGLATFATGPLYENFEGQAYLAMGALSAFGFAFAIGAQLLSRRFRS